MKCWNVTFQKQISHIWVFLNAPTKKIIIAKDSISDISNGEFMQIRGCSYPDDTISRGEGEGVTADSSLRMFPCQSRAVSLNVNGR